MDRIDYDLREAERLGYGIHYGHYKVDHPVSDFDPEAEAKPKPLPPRNCKECGKLYTPNRPNMWYCCDDCRDRRNAREGYQKRKTKKRFPIGQAICPMCGSDFYRKSIYTETCSRACAAYLREQRIREEKWETSSVGRAVVSRVRVPGLPQ